MRGIVAVATLALASPAEAVGQTRAESGVTGRTGHPFRMPTISPLESVYRLAPVHVSRGDRSLWLGLAELGDRWSFWLRQRPDERFELSGAFHLKAASRFDLESVQNTFVEITFRVGGYLRARLGKVAARVEVYHVSSHLGDEFLLEEAVERVSTSREGVDFLFQVAPADGLILYGGPGWLIRSTLPLATPSFRVGSEWESTADTWVRPYVGVDANAWAELDWNPQVATEAGIALGRNARLGLLFGFGPPRADQFLYETETLVGLSFTYRR
ncbi:MAG: DUF1207 domain-containing protein [Gemmatimonadota bacterium]